MPDKLGALILGLYMEHALNVVREVAIVRNNGAGNAFKLTTETWDGGIANRAAEEDESTKASALGWEMP